MNISHWKVFFGDKSKQDFELVQAGSILDVAITARFIRITKGLPHNNITSIYLFENCNYRYVCDNDEIDYIKSDES